MASLVVSDGMLLLAVKQHLLWTATTKESD